MANKESIISRIKQSVEKSGQTKADFINYVMADNKLRLRFITEFDSATAVVMHNDFDNGIDAVCRSVYGEDCPLCEEAEDFPKMRTQDKYCISAWDYENKRVRIFIWQATRNSPIDQLLSFYETYGTICDRDYVIERKGTGKNTKYKVIPMDKAKFKNDAKPYSEKKILKLLNEAFPIKSYTPSSDDDDDDDEDEKPKKGKKGSKKEEKSGGMELEDIQELLEADDIDEDEFCEYHNVKSLKKILSKSKKEIKAMIKEYNEFGVDDDDDEDDEDDDE